MSATSSATAPTDSVLTAPKLNLDERPRLKAFVATFSTHMEDGFEIDENLLNVLKCASEAAGWFEVSGVGAPTAGVVAGADTGAKVKKPRKAKDPNAPKTVNGYTYYLGVRCAELKLADPTSKTNNIIAKDEWNAFDKATKAEWKVKAGASSASQSQISQPVDGTTPAVVTAPKAPKAKSGYDLFREATLPSVQADTSIEAKKRVSHIAALWKALPTTDPTAHQNYLNSAKALIAVAV
jgi:hypothetical protein